MREICELQITQNEYNSLIKCEACVIREYESVGGPRFARVLACGDREEMTQQAATPGLYIVPNGFSIIHQSVVLVEELIDPVKEANSGKEETQLS